MWWDNFEVDAEALRLELFVPAAAVEAWEADAAAEGMEEGGMPIVGGAFALSNAMSGSEAVEEEGEMV